ncbi:MAG: hypothetical protein ACJA1S_001828 [Cellvibrionaceae bacterium]|jgi:hypothetical protein
MVLPADIATVAAYGESSFTVPVSTSLMGGIKVIRALMVSKGQNISYQLQAKLDIAIRFVPKLTVIQDGMIPLGQKSQ